MTKAFYISNHSASELHSAEVSTLPTLSTRPTFATKDLFVKWCHDIGTEHVFYTLVEPEQPAIRSSAQNPIKLLHGLVADYDGSADAINAALPALTFPQGLAPTWVTTTYSNKARLLWLFESPVPVFNPEVLTRVLASLAKEIGLKKLLPGLDDAYFNNAHTPYELGTNWRQPYGDTRLPHSMVMTHLFDASNKVKWKTDTIDIPIEAVEAEVNKRWPNRWNGPFVEGAKGVRFWDPKADNPTGCTIRATGVQAWSGEGTFLPWAEVLGAEFVKQYRQNRIGGAIDGTFFDGREYWRKDGEGIWQNMSFESIKRRLNVTFGLSNESRRGQASDVARALTTLEDINRVDGAFPCHFIKDDVVRNASGKYLNISRARLIPPAPGIASCWGDGFPWVARYLEGLFDDKQRDVFLSWLAHFYQTAARGKPKGGQALFIAGPTSCGKTLLTQKVVGGLMGGFQEATRYILGETTFNEQLVHVPVWTVDDAVASADPRSHTRYGQIVKKSVANPSQEFSAKFKKTSTMAFNFRLLVTLNTDEESVEMLPATDTSIQDKLVVLLARPPGVEFSNADEVVPLELPYFARYIANYCIPAELKRNSAETTRFGLDAYFHPELMETVSDASSASGLREILDMWRIHYFRRFSEKDSWSGSATDLMQEFDNDEMLARLSRTVTHNNRNVLGKNLRKLVNIGTPWLSIPPRSKSGRAYKILSPSAEAA